MTVSEIQGRIHYHYRKARLYTMLAEESLKSRLLAPLAPLYLQLADAERARIKQEISIAERIDEEVRKMRRNQYWRNSVLTGLLFTLAVMALLFIGPVIGQEGEATAVVTPDAEVTVIPAPGDDAPDFVLIPNIPPASDTIQLTWVALAGIIATTLSTGLAGGVVGATVIVRSVRQNDVIMNAMEKLYLSSPQERQENIRKGVDALKEISEFADEVTDGELRGEAQRVYSQRVIPPSPPGAEGSQG